MGWSPLIHTRFHVSRTTLDTASLSSLILQDSHLLWFAFPDNSSSINNGLCSPNPSIASNTGLGSSYFARHYFRNRVFFLFLQVLRCFSSLRSPPIHYFTHVWITRFFSLAEFPHSDICGSQDICSLPQLFAAYHVLLRLLVPRYPPYALCSLTLNVWKTSYCFANLQPNFPRRTHVLPRQICFDYQTTTRFWSVYYFIWKAFTSHSVFLE